MADEHRDGEHTKGSFTLDEPDGTQRIVEYQSVGKHGGFQPIVKRMGHAYHPDHYGNEHQEGSDEGFEHGHATSYQNNNLYFHDFDKE